MNTYSFKMTASRFALLVLSFMALINFAQAAVNATPAGGGGQAPNQINIIGGYSENYWTPQSKEDQDHQNLFLFTTSPSFGENLFASLIYSYVLQQGTNTLALTNTALNNLLINTGTSVQTTIQNSFTNPFLLAPPKQLPVLVSFDPSSSRFKADPADTGAATQKKNDQAISFYNINALIGTTQYTINTQKPTEPSLQEQQALGFINYITDQFDPISIIDFSKLYKIDDQTLLLQALNQISVQQYLTLMRKYAASISVGLNNLTYLYNERKAYPTQQLISSQGGSILANLPKDIHLPTELQQQASTLAIDRWMATRRLGLTTDDQGNKDSWYNKMEKATPATLARENVMLLAEIRYELFKNRMVNEKILATLSTMELQNIQNLKLQISNLQRAACSSDPLKSSGACPASDGTSDTANAAINAATAPAK